MTRNNLISLRCLFLCFGLITTAFAMPVRAATPSFAPSETLNASNPNQVLITDINKDKYLDLMTPTSVGMLSFLGDGHGGFTVNSSMGFITGTSQPTSEPIAYVDLNGHGNFALLQTFYGAALSSGNTTFGNTGSSPTMGAACGINVALQQNDRNFGTFTSNTAGTCNFDFTKLLVADLNHDGNMDVILVGSSLAPVIIGFGDGKGGFSKFYNPPGANGSAVAVGDVNHDGIPDLVVLSTDSLPNNISVMLGKGDGTFAPANTASIDNSWNEGKASPYGKIILVDLNGDGNLDIIAGSQGVPGIGYIGVLLNDGKGHFQPTTMAYGANQTFAVADIDGDGRQDLIVAPKQPITDPLSYAPLSVLQGNGSGGFGSPVILGTTVPNTVTDIAVADLNADGKYDIVTANSTSNTISILLNNTQGSSTPAPLPGTTTSDQTSNLPPTPPINPFVPLTPGNSGGGGAFDLIDLAGAAGLAAWLRKRQSHKQK